MAKCNAIVLETFGKHPCSQNSASESIEEKRESIGKDSIWKPSLLLSFNYEPAINACAHHGSPCRNRHTSWNIGLIHCGCSFAQVGATSEQSPRSGERAFLHMNPGVRLFLKPRGHMTGSCIFTTSRMVFFGQALQNLANQTVPWHTIIRAPLYISHNG